MKITVGNYSFTFAVEMKKMSFRIIGKDFIRNKENQRIEANASAKSLDQ